MRLALKPEYFDLVSAGYKRSTIRAGAKNRTTGPAMLVSGNKSMPITIVDVVIKRMDELTESDAQVDGFQSLAELRKVLVTFYPQLSPDDMISIFLFVQRDQ